MVDRRDVPARGRGRGRNTQEGRAPGICRESINSGCTCKNCRFSHEVGNSDNSAQRRVRVEETGEQQHASA